MALLWVGIGLEMGIGLEGGSCICEDIDTGVMPSSNPFERVEDITFSFGFLFPSLLPFSRCKEMKENHINI